MQQKCIVIVGAWHSFVYCRHYANDAW